MQCMAMCFFGFSPKCRILVFVAPFCYLGDPLHDGPVTAPNGNYTLYAKYGTKSIAFKAIS